MTMKVTVEFNDKDEALVALNADKLLCALFSLEQRFRNKWKYGEEGEDTKLTAAEVREIFYEEVGELLALYE